MRKGGFLLPVNSDGKILLVQSLSRKEYLGMWSLPGGAADSDESQVDCAVRETLEETGVVCEITNLNMAYDDEKHQISIKIFNAKQVSGHLKLQNNEIMNAKWLSIEEALSLSLAYNTREVINNFSKNADANRFSL